MNCLVDICADRLRRVLDDARAFAMIMERTLKSCLSSHEVAKKLAAGDLWKVIVRGDGFEKIQAFRRFEPDYHISTDPADLVWKKGIGQIIV